MAISTPSCAIVMLSLLLVPGAMAHQSKVTPIQTVIELLESLTVKVTEDGKAEATTYDKFACFCKQQVDDKLYAIETSTKLISDMDAKISDLDAKASALAGEISALKLSISADEESKKQEIQSRADENAEYLKDKGNLANGMAAVENAIAVLQEAKGSLADAKLTGSLVQKVRPVFAKFAPGQLALLDQLAGQPGSAAKYQYQGNQLLQTLADILASFKRNMKDMDIQEFEAKKASDAKVVGLTNKIAFETKDKEEKEALEAATREELAATQAERDAEDKAKSADSDFLGVVKDECEKKAEQWDKRSLMRADELKALNDATVELKTGALENFNANKKLVDLQQVTVKPKTKAVSLLQLRKVRPHGQDAGNAVDKVQAFLATTAGRLSSSVLNSAALKVLASKDHFVKVRALIKDLVAKLQADAFSEQTQKDYCDTNMARELASRDMATAQIETATANIDKLEADNAKLKAEIATLQEEIANLRKALAARTALRNDESAENGVTESMSDEGKAAVERAIQILTTYYDNAKTALVQKGGYVPPDADRSGKSIRDYQDEIFTTTYRGAQTESQGIIGILQTIQSDFTRTNDVTKASEKQASEDYDTYKSETEADIKAKEDDIEAKEGDITSNDSSLITEKENLKTATALKDGALASLAELKKACVDGEETYDERVKKRQEEIAALKQALDILIAWDKA
mmetsp:Transcript_153478/g.270859  ORF Transcript_153478/g.270859 Transcript_153478/m.270859 type:complete len:695 (-) Transcript_153478:63-2147(-)